MLRGLTDGTVDYGFHVKGNQTLQSLWSIPQASGTSARQPYGTHDIALPNYEWDYLILQSFPSFTNPTLGQERDRIQDFIGSVDSGVSNGNTKIIVYGPWAGLNESAWDSWDATVQSIDSQPTVAAAAYHDALYDEVESLFPGRVQLASAGKVIRSARDSIESGTAPITSIYTLYRDSIHLSNLYGSFLASTTIQTTVHGRSTVGESVPSNFYSQLPDDYIRWARLTVWETLVNDPRSGVATPAAGDFDGNGSIDYQDYILWEEDLGRTDRLLADASGNGIVDHHDYNTWLNELPIAILEGDINLDGKVTEKDYLLWKQNIGRTDRPLHDLSGNGVVDADDFLIWRDNLPVEIITGDYNLDEKVDHLDFLLFQNDFGQTDQLFADGNQDGVVDFLDMYVWLQAVSEANIAGDLNRDGRVNKVDLLTWQQAYGGTSNPQAISSQIQDANQDGVIDAADYTLWRDNADLLTIAGDFNSDGNIDADDLAIWVSGYGQLGNPIADANSDGIVNAADYTLWRDGFNLQFVDPLESLSRFDQEDFQAATSIPEPGTWVILFAGLCGLLPLRGWS